MLMAAAYLTMISSPASAQEKPDESTYVASLKECQAIADDAQRLACFDAASSRIVNATEAGELRLVDREAVKETRRKLFGFSLPDLGIFGRDDDGAPKEEKIDEIATTIAAVRGSYQNGYAIETAEGAVWRIDDVPRRLLAPKVGDPLVIKSGALSSYYIRIGKQGGVKAVRVR